MSSKIIFPIIEDTTLAEYGVSKHTCLFSFFRIHHMRINKFKKMYHNLI